MAHAVGTLALIDAIWPGRDGNRLLRNVILVLLGSAALTVFAYVQIPMWPVPMTMQPFAVLLIAMAFGWYLGGLTVSVYLAQGLVGLPVFANGGGIAYFAGPTGGYLLGFLAAAVVVGWLAERGWDRTPGCTFVAMLIGIAIIDLLGVGWLASLIGTYKAVNGGLTPFLLGDLIKALAATAVISLAWRFVALDREQPVHGRAGTP